MSEPTLFKKIATVSLTPRNTRLFNAEDPGERDAFRSGLFRGLRIRMVREGAALGRVDGDAGHALALISSSEEAYAEGLDTTPGATSVERLLTSSGISRAASVSILREFGFQVVRHG